MVRIDGETALPGEPETIFDRLLDPAVLARCIPGCERFDAAGEGRYEATLKVGVGAIKGTFQAKITISDIERPKCYLLTVEAKSHVGYGTGSARVELEPEGAGARLRYHADVKVSGLIAAVGQRLLGTAAQKLANEFFERLRCELAAP